MKKIFTLVFVFCYGAFSYAQSNGSAIYQEALNSFLTPPQKTRSSLTKVTDSIFFQRINQAGNIRLEKQNIFLYDSIAQEIRQFDFNYDIDTDSLLFIDQFNTTYNPGQIIEAYGRTVQNQYSNGGRKTENFRSDGALENTFEELWDQGAGTYVNERFTSNYFIPGTDLVDSIIAQVWEPVGQQWRLDRWDFQYFGNDDLRDSVYTYQWNTSTDSWSLASKITSEYDALGQQTRLQLFEWDNSTGGFELLLEILEYFNGDELKDSTHVYSYFGGYYGENLTIFAYDNDLVVNDTIYAWDAASNVLKLVNFQEYQYNVEEDLEELRTYAYDPVQAAFVQITQVNYHYSEKGLETGVIEAKTEELSCIFANPHLPGELITCDLEQAKIHARLYSLDGRLHFHQLLSNTSFQLPHSLLPGLYILSLEQPTGQLKHHKVIISPQ